MTTPSELADNIVRDVAELPDRTSPDDWPETMLVTNEELHLIVLGYLESAFAEVRREALEEAATRISSWDFRYSDGGTAKRAAAAIRAIAPEPDAGATPDVARLPCEGLPFSETGPVICQHHDRCKRHGDCVLRNVINTAPGHTDMMVAPEIMEANPLPEDPIEAALEALYGEPRHQWHANTVESMRRAIAAADRARAPVAPDAAQALASTELVTIEGDDIVIRITEGALTHATEHGVLCTFIPQTGNFRAAQITDASKWRDAVRRALRNEQENGDTPVHLMLDAALEYALEQGEEGVWVEGITDDP